VIGPLLGGILLAAEWPLQNIFFVFSVPLFMACGSILLLQAVERAKASVKSERHRTGQGTIE
jgi:hypothetical protein